MNRLLFGDNLPWLRNLTAFPDESAALVYLDPPFNSNATYNMLFHEESGAISQAQFHAFTDTWHWPDAEPTYREFIQTCQLADASELMEAFHTFLKTSQMMAYLAMMAPRLVELHRVLKPTGSIYLHCDSAASHYLKLLLDAIFGASNFQNEIIWQRTSAHNDPIRYGRIHDSLLFYTKTNKYTWNQQFDPPDEKFFEAHDFEKDEKGRLYRKRDLTAPAHGDSPSGQYKWKGKHPSKGRMWSYTRDNMEGLEAEGRIVYTKTGMPRLKIYTENLQGVPYQDIWARPELWLNAAADERLSYPTQKPEALLSRIIKTSSNEGDVVLDPFCGCGTTVVVAERLKRPWTGIDITYLAINLIKRRFESKFGKGAVAFVESGQPGDLSGAQRLAEIDRFQFQQWALNLVNALPLKGGSGKGADRGVDGLLYFHESKDVRQRILVQVKSGAVKRSDVATLLGDVGNQKAVAGILITLDAPTSAMRKEVADAGRYKSALWTKKDYPKVQILTIRGLLAGTERPDTPPLEDPFAKAPRSDSAEQISLVAAEAEAPYKPDSN